MIINDTTIQVSIIDPNMTYENVPETNDKYRRCKRQEKVQTIKKPKYILISYS